MGLFLSNGVGGKRFFLLYLATPMTIIISNLLITAPHPGVGQHGIAFAIIFSILTPWSHHETTV